MMVDGRHFNGQLLHFEYVELITNDCLDRDRPNGKVRIPGGPDIAKESFSMRTRFVEYGPEDLEWLIMSGIVEECREMYFYILNEMFFRSSLDFAPMFPDPRFLVLSSC